MLRQNTNTKNCGIGISGVSEVQALSILEPYCTILLGKVILSPDPAFLLKVPSPFQSQDIIPSLHSNKRENYAELDVGRILMADPGRTKDWGKTSSLFVLYSRKR